MSNKRKYTLLLIPAIVIEGVLIAALVMEVRVMGIWLLISDALFLCVCYNVYGIRKRMQEL